MIVQNKANYKQKRIALTTRYEHEIEELFRLASRIILDDPDDIYDRDLFFECNLGNDGVEEYSLIISK